MQVPQQAQIDMKDKGQFSKSQDSDFEDKSASAHERKRDMKALRKMQQDNQIKQSVCSSDDL